MNHQNTTDFLKIVTSSAAQLDVIISYVIETDGQQKELNFYQSISSATTTSLSFADAGRAIIKSLSIKNTDGSTANTLTLYKNNGSSDFMLLKATMAAGDGVHYERGSGWSVLNSSGKLKVETAASGGGSAAWGSITGTLSDQTDLQAALDAKQDVITDSDDITEGATNLFMTGTERTKVGNLTISGPVDLDTINTRVNDLDAAVVLRGSWDASAGTFPGGGTAQAGSSYIVSVAGTVDGVDFEIGDRIVCILDNGSTSTYAANWLKLDYSDKVNTVNGQTGTVVLDADDIDDSATTNKFTTAAEISKLAGIETGADVTDETNVGSSINGAAAKTTPVTGDFFAILDSAASNVLKKLTLANLMTFISSFTMTLTNKRITWRTGTDTSSATPTINTDNVDYFSLTAQAVDVTSFTTNLSGTPTEGQPLHIAITGTASRAITWGASFEDGPATLPTTTSGTSRLDVFFRWNSVTSKFRCMAQG